MDMKFKGKFLDLWDTYFGGSELPIVCSYKDQEGSVEVLPPPSGHQCVIGVLSRVRRGTPLIFEAASIGCSGGKRYLGFSDQVMPDFEYFLSCGIPGKLVGERYKKSPELVREIMKKIPIFKAPGRFIEFKRWDSLVAMDNPDVAIFFAPPDVLSGLFTLANFDEVDPNGIFSPFAAGCGAIVQYPYLEKAREHPRGVLGMFDISARPCVPKDTLSISFPMNKFVKMIMNMDESFLITSSWGKVRNRINKKSI